MGLSFGRRCVVTAAVLVVALAALPRSASAQDAEGLIREGVQLRRRGEDAKAHGYFQRAYDVAPTPRTAAQLGLSDLALGKWLDAEIHLTESLSTPDPWVDGNRATIDKSRAKARAQLGRIEIQGAPADSRVEATGRAASKLPVDGIVWVSPGPVHIRIQAPGRKPATEETSVSMGGTARVTVSLAVEEPEPKATQVPPADLRTATASGTGTDGDHANGASAGANGLPPAVKTRQAAVDEEDATMHRRLRIAGIAVGAVGLAAGATGIVLRVMAGHKADAITSDGKAGLPYNPDNGNYQTLDKAGVGLLVGGGVALGAGVVCSLLNRDSNPDEGPTVSVRAGAGSFALALNGRY